MQFLHVPFLLGTLRYYTANSATLPQHNDSTEDENISELAIHYMKENMEKHLSLQDIADQIGYSPSHFSMLFKKKTGHGPVTYFNLLKIQHACFYSTPRI